MRAWTHIWALNVNSPHHKMKNSIEESVPIAIA
jgi:hypothetical protein